MLSKWKNKIQYEKISFNINLFVFFENIFNFIYQSIEVESKIYH